VIVSQVTSSCEVLLSLIMAGFEIAALLFIFIEAEAPPEHFISSIVGCAVILLCSFVFTESIPSFNSPGRKAQEILIPC
jgi:hypothetical protein